MAQPQRIVTLPNAMVPHFGRLEERAAPDWFATSDPVGAPLGSGGGTAHALLEAWRASGSGSFDEWLRARRRTVVHAGGQSRRLPAYAAVGKALIPIPVPRGSVGAKPDGALIDLQVSLFDALFERAAPSARVLVASGDALILPTRLPTALPDADVVMLATATNPKEASHHGAFFLRHDRPERLDRFLQKPHPELTASLVPTHEVLLDVGVWLLSERAVRALLSGCGVIQDEDGPQPWDLYSEFGAGLGETPECPHPALEGLTAAVVEVPAQFLHFGTSRQLIDSTTRLHQRENPRNSLGFVSAAKRHPDQHVQNARFDGLPPLAPGEAGWIENAFVPPTWDLEGENVVTGVPPNDWTVRLARGVCVDVAPVEGGWCLRPYGYDDAFKGRLDDPSTTFLGRPIGEWLAAHGVEMEADDIQNAPLFPVAFDQAVLAWMLDLHPDAAHPGRALWLEAKRLSAADLLACVEVDRLYEQRRKLLAGSLQAMQKNARASVFYALDLERAAAILGKESPEYVAPDAESGESLAMRMHHHMFRSAVRRAQGASGWEQEEAEAFGALRNAILRSLPPSPEPRFSVAEDGIVWGRAPLRFDLAGGWTDTPPYCLLNGGQVLNVAVELNGQPPIGVFARRSERNDVLLRSIDLGTERRFTTFEELDADLSERSEFSLAQAALRLAGFSPETGVPSLEKALERFGGGIELSLLAAVPKGSGLGTSSILASTILATLSTFAGLDWSPGDVMARTLALEQILGTGGGWQDQAGGCLHGVKVLESQPGIVQTPVARWLPERLLGPSYANETCLLYYTGITRVAKSVLREIVRGMFLNSGPRLEALRAIGANVAPTAEAIQREDIGALGACVRRSWELNQELDPGTNPPSVQTILDKIEDLVEGAKLLGAGGGGFLFIVAKGPDAARRIREILRDDPPSKRARFYDFRVSPIGLEVTAS
jgi:galactokinase/mevalonate kinase-like predicted kinase